MDLRSIDPTDVGVERRRSLSIGAVLGVVALLAALDLVIDLQDGTTVRHAIVEGTIVLSAGFGVVVMLRRFAALRRSERAAQGAVQVISRHLEQSRIEAERWRSEAKDLLAGLGELIDRQLAHWQLSSAEKDVALLLLKGLSHKEIAATRAVGEATVRQQAAAIYKKAGVDGRHDLSAFFLEDLLAPRGPDPRR